MDTILLYAKHMENKTNGFNLRLKEALDDMHVPDRGRQMLLSRRYNVSQPTAKRWLDGTNYPEIEKLQAIAQWTNTSIDWLLTGTGPKNKFHNPDNSSIFQEAFCILNSLDQTKIKLAVDLLRALSNSK